jgi:hypothetical protein
VGVLSADQGTNKAKIRTPNEKAMTKPTPTMNVPSDELLKSNGRLVAAKTCNSAFQSK